MSEDLTRKLPESADEKLTLILNTVQRLALDVPTRADLDTRLRRLEQKVEERLYDTKPIWQKAVADIAQLQSAVGELQQGQLRLEQGQQTLHRDITDFKSSVRDILRYFRVLNDKTFGIQAEQRDLDERIAALEERKEPPNSQT